MTIGELLGDGSNGARRPCARSRRDDPSDRASDCRSPGERALYKRAISRSHAEWPLVEVCARAVVSDGAFQLIRIAAGGDRAGAAAPSASEAALAGQACRRRDDRGGGEATTAGAKPLPMTGYKLDLLSGLVRDLLEQLAA